MTDLYETLGINKNADTATVRKAYKKKAAKTHPDVPGGSKEKFGLIKLAADVLSDAKRREKYDATGNVDDEQDLGMTGTLQIVNSFLENILNGIEKRHMDPAKCDIAGMMIAAMEEQIEKNEVTISQNKAVVAKAEKLLGRFSVKSGKNYLEDMLKYKLKLLKENAANSEKICEELKKAYDIVKQFSYRKDEEPLTEHLHSNPIRYRQMPFGALYEF